MSEVFVKASRGGSHHRFSLQPASPTIKYPTFQSLCDAIVHHLNLPTTASALADPQRAQFHIFFLDDEGDLCRLVDDLSLREAIRLSPGPLRLRIRLARTKSKPDAHDPEQEPSSEEQQADDNGQCDPPVHIFSPPELLKLLKHMRHHSPPTVSAALAELNKRVQCHPGDAAALRRRRHELAGLFSVFLAEAALPGDSCISKKLSVPLIYNLCTSMEKAGANKHTISAATKAVRAVCSCKPAVELLRSQYADAACRAASRKAEEAASSPDTAVTQASPATAVMAATLAPTGRRPVIHYVNQFKRMRRRGGPEVQEAYRQFEQARRHAGVMPAFKLSRALCRGLQRATFHFLRCHVSDSDFEFEQRAVKALADSVARKLIRAGYDERLVDVTMQLVVAMATDQEVIRFAYRWVSRLKEESPDEEGAGDQPVDAEAADDSGELEAIAKEVEEERMQTEASRKSASNPSSRRQSVQSVHEDEDVGDEEESNESLASIDSLHDDEEMVQSQPMNKRMNEFSPVHSSDDLSPDGGNDGNRSGSEGPRSSDTQRSQWARVQLAKEREEQLRKARLLDRQMARERQLEIDLARERLMEEELERQRDRASIGSQRLSRRSSRAGSARGRGASVRGGSMRGSLRSLSIGARNIGDEGSRAGSADMRGGGRQPAGSFRSGSIDPREQGSVRGSARRSVRSSRSTARSHASAKGSVKSSRAGSRTGGSVASSRRGSRTHGS